MAKRLPQLELLKKQIRSYGGELLKTRKGRMHGRPLDTKNTMHLVLRSSKAMGKWSFQRAENKIGIQNIISKFSRKYGVTIRSLVNVGNHLHLEIKLSNRYTYAPFIRAITSAIAMAVTGVNRWNRSANREKFWDYRPFSRVVIGFKAVLGLKDYFKKNELEGFGLKRSEAVFIVKNFKKLRDEPYLRPS